jgi:hypothetical protein
LKTQHVSTVIYPSSLFSLEKDEVYPYERFAYNLLDVAIAALNVKGLPERVTLRFSTAECNTSPWSITANVRCELDSATQRPVGYHFSMPELVPAMAYCYCFLVGLPLLKNDNADFHQRLLNFVHAANAGIQTYKESGIASAIRACYEQLGLTILVLNDVANCYDLLTKLIAFHEVGHCYALHLTGESDSNVVTRQGSELIADLLATTWLYNKMIRNTPDNAEYRAYRGFSSYSESVFANCLDVQRAQQLLLCFSALAGAQRSGGTLTLARGRHSHPSGHQRYMLQHIHLGTLIESNFSGTLSPEQVAALDDAWYQNMKQLVTSGMIPIVGVESTLDPRECDTFEAAATSIEEKHIEELQPIVPFLRNAREMMSDSTNRNASRRRPF